MNLFECLINALNDSRRDFVEKYGWNAWYALIFAIGFFILAPIIAILSL